MKAKKFLSMILALTMILSLMTTLNVSAARTKSIDVNDSVSGSFYYDEEDDDDTWYYTWYELSVAKDGLLELELLGDPELYLSVSIYDESKNERYSYASGEDQTIKLSRFLSTGDYYVRVETSEYSRESGDYTLESSFEVQPLANDKEPNDSFQKALTYNIDTEITGHIGYAMGEEDDVVDWYKMSIPVEGYLELSLLADPGFNVYLYLYRNDGASYIQYVDGEDRVISINQPLLPGDYYIKVSKSEYNHAAGGYTLSNTFKIFGKTNESEPNDSFQKSKEMSDGGVYVGTIGSYSDEEKNDGKDAVDWYKIYVPAGVYLRADLAAEDTLSAEVNIYNTDGGSEMRDANIYDGGNAYCYTKIDTAGTYYVSVNYPRGYGRYAVKATTSISEPRYTSTLLVPDDPTAYQEVTIPTSTTVETTPTVSKNETTNYIILQVDNPLMNANGKPEAIDAGIGTTPIVYNGRTLVPIRAIVEKMGGTVGWDGATSSITLTYKSTTIKLVVDSTTATVNGATKTLDVAPMVLNGRTLLPIRFITENFGGEVGWEDRTSTITLKY